MQATLSSNNSPKRCKQPDQTKVTACIAAFLAAAFLSIVAVCQASDKTFFKITNEAGHVELKATITPDEAKRGYAIVTLGGHVIEEVPPQMTPEEYTRFSEELRIAEQQKQRAEAERIYDESLLLRYSSLDDLEAERRRKLSEFDVRISILRSNLLGLKEKLENQQARAANIERQGSTVPGYINKNIEELESEMRESEAAIKSRQQEKQKVDDKYSADGERLSKLLVQNNYR